MKFNQTQQIGYVAYSWNIPDELIEKIKENFPEYPESEIIGLIWDLLDGETSLVVDIDKNSPLYKFYDGNDIDTQDCECDPEMEYEWTISSADRKAIIKIMEEWE